ncbi:MULTISPECIES: hypothetical protein [unclassified Bradyrhizobium]|uniref:hypothetical protein n=1 Tax=unclassified Bradyrhizobium TaxID=2631580 RepID=UPI0028F033E7|nr:MULTISPECIES: hypothetical protein [unclassified Bradyrhizobium]
MKQQNPSIRRSLAPMSRRALIGAALCAPLAACGREAEHANQALSAPPDARESAPENQPLPIPSDQANFQRLWGAARINNRTFHGPALNELPRELNKWTGKLLVRNIANGQVELLVIRIADNLAVVAYGYKDRVLRAYADNYVEFSATQLDDSLVWRHSDELQVAGIWALVKVNLNSITTPRLPKGPGW